MNHLGLFEGIGGFSLAARWMGWETIAWCEWNEFCQKILKYHFPESEAYGDITKINFKKYEGKIDIITGGFPCQPFSTAGKRKGTEDERHLWPEMLRAIREIKSPWVVGENVLGIINWGGGLVFEQVQIDLETEGYEVQTFILPACGKNAPHRRDRVWFVAYSNSNDDFRRSRKNEGESEKERLQERHKIQLAIEPNKIRLDSDPKSQQSKRNEFIQSEISQSEQGKFRRNNSQICNGSFADSFSVRQSESGQPYKPLNTKEIENWKASWAFDDNRWPTQPTLCNGNDGLSSRLDGISIRSWREESIKAGGNAIVPQLALEIYKAIEAYKKTQYV